MISSIFLYNIKKHLNTKIELHKGLNVISGTSDHGKSSIILGLYWCLFNKPNGINYVSFGKEKKGCYVQSNFDNGLKIKRLLTKSKNEYHINGEVYKSFRFDVPEEMKELLFLDPANIQLQADPYFMIQDSPTEVGRMFNEIKGINEIEQTLKNASKITTDLKTDLEFEKTNIKEQQTIINKYKNVDILNERIIALEKKQTKYNEKIQEAKTIKKEIENISQYEKEMGTLRNLIKSLQSKVNNVLKQINKLETGISEYKETYSLIKKTQKYQNEIEHCKSLLPLQESVDRCLHEINSHREKQAEISKLQDLMNSQTQLMIEYTETAGNLRSLEEEKERIQEELKVCPLCDNYF